MGNCLYCQREFNGDRSGIILGAEEGKFYAIFRGELIEHNKTDSVTFCHFGCLAAWFVSCDENIWLKSHGFTELSEQFEDELNRFKMNASTTLRELLAKANAEKPFKFLYYNPKFAGYISNRSYDVFGIPIIYTDRIPKGSFFFTDKEAF